MKARDETFRYYFYFMQERMNIFWKRFHGQTDNLTDDKILSSYKFTNVYRILDRVSQYLLKEVIYNGSTNFSEADILFRIILFKVFNNIDTWEYLQYELEVIGIETFDVNRISALLSERIKTTPIFNGAYIMNGSHARYNQYNSKHRKWLQMIQQELLTEGRLQRIIQARSLEEVYNTLRECTFIGSFLAYQYTIDLNYSPVINFDENSFVKAGIGAIRGIQKCYELEKQYTYEDYIKFTHEHLEFYRTKWGFTGFKNLFGREPTLIDLQNCFCETDKYLRVSMPQLKVGNTRIKQKFSSPKSTIDLYLPPKWHLV